ncbi:hypothetical protein Q0590_25055 [Rhodocytophaga aerolata]|uniref:DUF1565 domain-containing protein n=1 Tax=Rhodocytophaga aerolata TaxID=455078 RepID=A0ABT8RBT1_9BACT|nr:hypothetical protein [Rhodocytophaga aerolata]MDO1449570.1 hypothetical protein [Rhodocytophaga aerolata]
MPKHYLNENLVDSSLGLFYKNREVILALNMGRIFYVNGTDGDDTTGARGRFDKPYKTISAAIAAAPNTGDIIEVMTGTYNENVTGKVSGFTHLVLRGATINGNININNNTGSGVMYLLQGSRVNGSYSGTFGGMIISDGSGIWNGQLIMPNGSGRVKGLRTWSTTTTSLSDTLTTNCIIEDIDLVESSYEWNFRTGDNVEGHATNRNAILRNIRILRNTSELATARVFNPVNEISLDTIENIGLIECRNGKIHNDLWRPFRLFHCQNVTFKSKLQSFYAQALTFNAYNSRFICTDESIFKHNSNIVENVGLMKFYQCQFQAGAVAPSILENTNFGPKLELFCSQYNKANFNTGIANTTESLGFNSVVETINIRTAKY